MFAASAAQALLCEALQSLGWRDLSRAVMLQLLRRLGAPSFTEAGETVTAQQQMHLRLCLLRQQLRHYYVKLCRALVSTFCMCKLFNEQLRFPHPTVTFWHYDHKIQKFCVHTSV